MYLSNTKTIVFITGAFISHSCWTDWVFFFENKGYKAVAPPWPYKNESADELRNEKSESKIASLRLDFLVAYYTEIIEKLSERPILIGHSYGGLLTQLLIQKELGSAGVCLHSFPPRGIISSKICFYKALWKPLGYFTSTQKTYLIPFHEWQSNFTNGIPFEEQKDFYEQLVIPESKLVLRDVFTKTTKVNFGKKHVPLLFLSGSDDNIVPASLNYSIFKKYKNVYSITCYKEFKSKNHLVLVQSDWENVALFITEWLQKVLNLTLFLFLVF